MPTWRRTAALRGAWRRFWHRRGFFALPVQIKASGLLK